MTCLPTRIHSIDKFNNYCFEIQSKRIWLFNYYSTKFMRNFQPVTSYLCWHRAFWHISHGTNELISLCGNGKEYQTYCRVCKSVAYVSGAKARNVQHVLFKRPRPESALSELLVVPSPLPFPSSTTTPLITVTWPTILVALSQFVCADRISLTN